MTNRTNNLTDIDNISLSQRNREITSRQRYENRARHSKFWTSISFLLDRLYSEEVEGNVGEVPQPRPATSHTAFQYTGFEAGAI